MRSTRPGATNGALRDGDAGSLGIWDNDDAQLIPQHLVSQAQRDQHSFVIGVPAAICSRLAYSIVKVYGGVQDREVPE